MRTRVCLVAAIVAVLLAGGCSSRDDSSPSLPTLPIPTEAPLPPRTVPPPTTTLAPTTTAVPPPVSVLVRYEAKSAAEQEVIEAMKVLLPIQYQVSLNLNVTAEVIALAYAGSAFTDVFRDSKSFTAGHQFSEPGDVDRFVIRRVTSVSPNAGTAEACFANNAKSYVQTESARPPTLVDASTATRTMGYTLARGPDGWRFTVVQVLNEFLGVDQCGV